MSIYRTAVNKPVTTALLFVAFAIFGVFSFMKTSIALYPDFDANVILVMSSYPGASAADIETNLTKVLENGLNGVEDLKDMTSKSKENISIITLEFNYGVEIEEATNNVRDKLAEALSVLRGDNGLARFGFQRFSRHTRDIASTPGDLLIFVKALRLFGFRNIGRGRFCQHGQNQF